MREILDAINYVGFPIVATLLLSGFMCFVIKWLMKQFERLYQDYRVDFQKNQDEMFDKFEEITKNFSSSLKGVTEEHTVQNNKNIEFAQEGNDRLLERMNKTDELIRKEHKKTRNIIKK